MADEKDRYGDKLRDAEKAREDKYFAERDRALLDKLRASKTADDEETLAQLALMRCPKDGTRLAQKTHLDVTFEECPRCEGIWFDKGEMEEHSKRESSGWLARYFGRNRS
jgi:hypothetical protein